MQDLLVKENSEVSQPNSSVELKIATLNYCGIMNNPFQFYNEKSIDELSEISQTFNKIVHLHGKAQEGAKFNWGMGKVETKVRIGRYSPSFQLDVGFIGDTFLTREQFFNEWDRKYKETTQKSGLNFDVKNVQSARYYDFVFFHALLSYVFKEDDYDKLIKNSPKVYVQALKKFYEASYLDEDKKLVKVKEHLFKLEADVLFLQQYSPMLQEYISTLPGFYYCTDQSKDTIIVIKTKSFKKIVQAKSVLTQAEINDLNWNEKTAILIVDNIILINAHLNSKKEKNLVQKEELKASLIKVKSAHPDYKFIIGGDLNGYLGPEQKFTEYFNMFPIEEKEVTCLKKRTYAQGQYEKSNIKDQSSKDKIITDLPIVANSSKVTYIDNETRPNTNSFIPSDDHPFDHFLVACNVVSNH